jgi:hypothetical protein
MICSNEIFTAASTVSSKLIRATMANVWQELDEYVVTRELDGHLRKFFDAYLAAQDNPAEASGNVGVWVSGFFG